MRRKTPEHCYDVPPPAWNRNALQLRLSLWANPGPARSSREFRGSGLRTCLMTPFLFGNSISTRELDFSPSGSWYLDGDSTAMPELRESSVVQDTQQDKGVTLPFLTYSYRATITFHVIWGNGEETCVIHIKIDWVLLAAFSLWVSLFVFFFSFQGVGMEGS